MAIEPKSKVDQEKLEVNLSKLVNEDPTFRFYTDVETGQGIIAGMGELHLEIMLDRLNREYNILVQSGEPRVSYKESIKSSVSDVEGDPGWYRVSLKVRPHFKYMGASFTLSLVGKLDKE